MSTFLSILYFLSIELTVQIDRRATLSKLKRVIGRRFKIPTNHLKLFRIYSNNQVCIADSLLLPGNISLRSNDNVEAGL